MAGFKCDICGGQIKMQTNNTGVCQSCGMEYDIEVIRQMANNDKANKSENKSNVILKLNNDKSSADNMNRDALLVYLSNLRTIESVISKSKECLSQLKKRRNDIQLSQRIAEQEYERVKESEPQNQALLMKNQTAKYVVEVIFLVILVVLSFMIGNIEGFVVGLFLTLIPTCCFYYDRMKYKQEYLEYNLSYKIRYKEWSVDFINKKNRYNQIKEKAPEKLNSIKEAKEEISRDIENMSETLNKAYSLNIIPMQFRNIEGIFFLYDYLSTSNQSLSEALVQGNLDAIKKNLDQIMKTQAEQVVIQAQQNALLSEINNKTTIILQSALDTASNSEMIAKYTEMISINTEVIKQMQHKQLNYQRADFWLK